MQPGQQICQPCCLHQTFLQLRCSLTRKLASKDCKFKPGHLKELLVHLAFKAGESMLEEDIYWNEYLESFDDSLRPEIVKGRNERNIVIEPHEIEKQLKKLKKNKTFRLAAMTARSLLKNGHSTWSMHMAIRACFNLKSGINSDEERRKRRQNLTSFVRVTEVKRFTPKKPPKDKHPADPVRWENEVCKKLPNDLVADYDLPPFPNWTEQGNCAITAQVNGLQYILNHGFHKFFMEILHHVECMHARQLLLEIVYCSKFITQRAMENMILMVTHHRRHAETHKIYSNHTMWMDLVLTIETLIHFYGTCLECGYKRNLQRSSNIKLEIFEAIKAGEKDYEYTCFMCKERTLSAIDIQISEHGLVVDAREEGRKSRSIGKLLENYEEQMRFQKKKYKLLVAVVTITYTNRAQHLLAFTKVNGKIYRICDSEPHVEKVKVDTSAAEHHIANYNLEWLYYGKM